MGFVTQKFQKCILGVSMWCYLTSFLFNSKAHRVNFVDSPQFHDAVDMRVDFWREKLWTKTTRNIPCRQSTKPHIIIMLYAGNCDLGNLIKMSFIGEISSTFQWWCPQRRWHINWLYVTIFEVILCNSDKHGHAIFKIIFP